MNNQVGKAVLGGLLTLAAWRALGESGRGKVLDLLAGVAEAIDQQQRLVTQREAEGRLAAMRHHQLAVGATAGTVPLTSVNITRVKPASLESLHLTEGDARWREIICYPGVVLILGSRGSGKSALAYRLLELLRYRFTPYVVATPKSARSLIPGWIGMAPTIHDLPEKSIALIDEAYLLFHARNSSAQESKEMSQAINLARQREQVLLFVSQEARQLDRNIASSANVVVLKNLGVLQMEFERPELKKLVTQAKEAFSSLVGETKGWSYVYAPDANFAGLQVNDLASFWKPALSRVFSQTESSGTSTSAEREAPVTGPKAKAARAKELRARGLSYSQIAQELGVSKGTVANYLRGYPYKPTDDPDQPGQTGG